MATVRPCHVIIADNADDLATVKAYLDRIGYKTTESTFAERVDKDAELTVTIDYPEWVL